MQSPFQAPGLPGRRGRCNKDLGEGFRDLVLQRETKVPKRLGARRHKEEQRVKSPELLLLKGRWATNDM